VEETTNFEIVWITVGLVAIFAVLLITANSGLIRLDASYGGCCSTTAELPW